MQSPRLFGRIALGYRLLGGLVLLFGFLSGSLQSVRAQDQDLQARRQETEQRLKQLEAQIQREKNRLAETRAAEKATQKKLESIRREIALREELVSTYQTRLQQLEQERASLRDTLSTLQSRLEELRQEYRLRIVHAYKYGRLRDLALLLASRSINQMLIRARYLQRFAADRREQRSAIQTAAAEIRRSRKQLAAKRAETRRLLAEARTERQNLQALERDRRQLIEKLRNREAQLKREIKRRQQQRRQLEEQIQELVARARRQREETEPSAEAPETEDVAPSANLSASFQKNRGELPWPSDGVVTVGFGPQQHSEYETSTYHPGIQIATNPASPVQAVFEGTVTGINFVPGYGTYVVINHGKYFSVYSNFSSLGVNEGDRVQAGQQIGQAGTEDQPLGASLFFGVGVANQSSSDFVDPTDWLSSR